MGATYSSTKRLPELMCVSAAVLLVRGTSFLPHGAKVQSYPSNAEAFSPNGHSLPP